MAPLSGETALSFLSRLAGGYRVGVKDLIAALVGGESALRSRWNARPDGEVYLTSEVCSGLAQFCQIPEAHLERALPMWGQRPQLVRGDFTLSCWPQTQVLSTSAS
ncbi:hypothetical protein HEP87_02065 [Streptomyces sp. S1D4-11]|nr:hypothetical protein [Streptomyces sp. S1D4-11]QIY93200.1 hypothetical protein HEP87_02065 [Streptomyces sp. S1D4-11]